MHGHHIKRRRKHPGGGPYTTKGLAPRGDKHRHQRHGSNRGVPFDNTPDASMSRQQLSPADMRTIRGYYPATLPDTLGGITEKRSKAKK